MSKNLEYYCQWAKLRVVSDIESCDHVTNIRVYRYKVQTQKRFLWWKWWHTELSCNSRKIAKDVYYELMDRIREKRNENEARAEGVPFQRIAFLHLWTCRQRNND